ncbi:MAG TPA: nucleoside transporter C-terminal domain-containing protein, partial [Caulobacteraceae bacterium]|nr:nucleoside transporter C-terminal domain-containing protein [Caulobacteraceae bacterium]
MFTIENAQSLLGVVVIIGLCWAASEARGRFPWRMAIGAVAAQAALVVILFSVPAARALLAGAAAGVQGLAGSTQAGVAFVFGFLAGGEGQPYGVTNPGALFILAFRVLPVILVVCAVAALLWHWRILRWLIQAFGFVFQRTMGLRGAPALATAATVFMGQVEGPIFIRSYLAELTRSELFLLLTVGMSCVAGSTVVAYSIILAGAVPNAAEHVLTASLISAPAGVLLARILVPREPEAEAKSDFNPATVKTYASSIDALMKGTDDGLHMVLAIGATLLVFVALIAVVNGALGMFGPVAGAPLSVQRGLGYLFAPLAWAIGIPWREAGAAGSLLGTKLVLTEFTAFVDLTRMTGLSERTRVVMTYALCGFGNIASAGINVAGYTFLIPERRDEV